MLALRTQGGDAPLAFDQCRVESFADAVAICDNPRPTTRTEAKFSLQYAVVAAAEFGALRPEHFDESAFLRQDLHPRMQRVKIQIAPDITSRYPAHYGARVALTLADGRTVGHEVADSLGDPEMALSERAVMDKADTLMRYAGVHPARIGEALDAVARLLVEGDAKVMAAPFPTALLQPLFKPN